MGHDFADIEEGEGLILTIKDRGVLDEDGNSDVREGCLTFNDR